MEKYHSKPKEWASFSQTGNHSRSGDRSQKHTQSLSKSQLPTEVVFHRETQKKQTHHLQDPVMSSKCLITSICSFKVLQNTIYVCVCVCVCARMRACAYVCVRVYFILVSRTLQMFRFSHWLDWMQCFLQHGNSCDSPVSYLLNYILFITSDKVDFMSLISSSDQGSWLFLSCTHFTSPVLSLIAVRVTTIHIFLTSGFLFPVLTLLLTVVF